MAREKSAELAMPERSFGGQFGAGSQKQLKPSTLCVDIAQKHWVLTFAFARHSIGYSR